MQSPGGSTFVSTVLWMLHNRRSSKMIFCVVVAPANRINGVFVLSESHGLAKYE